MISDRKTFSPSSHLTLAPSTLKHAIQASTANLQLLDNNDKSHLAP